MVQLSKLECVDVTHTVAAKAFAAAVIAYTDIPDTHHNVRLNIGWLLIKHYSHDMTHSVHLL